MDWSLGGQDYSERQAVTTVLVISRLLMVLKNDKFHSIDTANTVTDSGLGLLISRTEKGKN